MECAECTNLKEYNEYLMDSNKELRAAISKMNEAVEHMRKAFDAHKEGTRC